MDPNLREFLELVFRWVHLIAGIMWVGNSMLFNWLDRNLIRRAGLSPNSDGEIWLLHSGGFYRAEKTQLEPHEMPEILHWFKWQAGITWITGIFLLTVVYYLSAGAFMIDPAVSGIHPHAAVALGIATLVGGWIVYDLLCRTPLLKHEGWMALLGFVIIEAVAYGLGQVLSGRAAFIHVGALIGTLMAGNVWMVIVPSQRELVAKTKAGSRTDLALAYKAKQRSIHNNYLTFPLLYLMISNHFPATFSHHQAWLVMGVLILAGAFTRHLMNIRFTFKAWRPVLTGILAAAVLALVALYWKPAEAPAPAATAHVTFAQAHAVIQGRCTVCHSATPTDDTFHAAPAGVMFDRPEQIQRLAERIKARAAVLQTMPLGNKTRITPEERALLGHWVDEGAKLE